MAPHRTSIRSIAEPSVLAGTKSPSATIIKHHTLAACISESGRTRGTQAKKKACEYCYRVHKRCSGTFPCDRCIKAGCAAECTEHKRQRHSRRGDVPAALVSSISSLRPFTRTANDQTHSSIPVERDIRVPAMAIPCSPTALPSPSLDLDLASHALLPVPDSPLAVSHAHHVDTVSSPSLTDSSTTSDENTSPIEDVLAACLAGLVGEQWMDETAVRAWDTLTMEQLEHHGGPAVSEMLTEDAELWSFIDTLIPLPAPAVQAPTDSRPDSPGFFLT